MQFMFICASDLSSRESGYNQPYTGRFINIIQTPDNFGHEHLVQFMFICSSGLSSIDCYYNQPYTGRFITYSGTTKIYYRKIINLKVKESHYRPGVAQRVPRS